MAILRTGSLTIADMAARINNGAVTEIIEALAQNNAILDDLTWLECNDGSRHRTTIRTGLPQGSWRAINEGVPVSKSTTAQIVDTTAMLEGYSQIDEALVRLSGDAKAFIRSENDAFLEGFSQQMAQALFYGSEDRNGRMFTGLSSRFNTRDTAANPAAANVLDAGGRGSTNTSIWLCCWGDATGHGIFPKGLPAGLIAEDVTTKQPVETAPGKKMQAIQYHYSWHCGLSIRDWRYFVRIANIDVTQLTKTPLVDLIMAAFNKTPTLPAAAAPLQQLENGPSKLALSFGKPCFYMNRTMATALQLAASNRNNLLLTEDQWAGKPQTLIRGIPVRITDQIMNTEDTVY